VDESVAWGPNETHARNVRRLIQIELGQLNRTDGAGRTARTHGDWTLRGEVNARSLRSITFVVHNDATNPAGVVHAACLIGDDVSVADVIRDDEPIAASADEPADQQIMAAAFQRNAGVEELGVRSAGEIRVTCETNQASSRSSIHDRMRSESDPIVSWNCIGSARTA
jgi:hypothetical protein